MFALLATVFLVAEIFSDSFYSIYLFLFFRFNNNHDECIPFVMANFILCYLLIVYCVRLFGSVANMYAMWTVHCLSALVSWTHLCVSHMLDAGITTDSYTRAVTCRCVAC